VDTVALVSEQIKAGQQLVERLRGAGIPLTAAAWVKPTERYQWYLYLVTPLVGEDRAVRPASRRIRPIVRALQDEGVWIEPSDLMLIGTTEATGEAIAAISRQVPPRRFGTRYGGASLGELSIDDAYVYAPPATA
jgi:hypothetical protein